MNSSRAELARGRSRSAAVWQDVPQARPVQRPVQSGQHLQLAALARFFIDLRRALGLTVPQAALAVMTTTEVIEALETGTVSVLPPWHETARIVVGYTRLAAIDGRSVLTVLGDVMSQPVAAAAAHHANIAHAAPTTRPNAAMPAHGASGGRGRALAANANRLRRQAVARMRERPDRAFYAISLPLGLILLLLNTSAIAGIARPISGATRWLSVSISGIFPTVRDGLRWIETDDPRSRRADKLPIKRRLD